VAGSVRIAVAGSEILAFAVDATTGLVTFDTAPADGAEITAGYAFDIPVRIDAHSLSINLASFAAGEIPSVPLIEVLL
jgi:uncharacterized protein (TIGR02217 family)